MVDMCERVAAKLLSATATPPLLGPFLHTRARLIGAAPLWTTCFAARAAMDASWNGHSAGARNPFRPLAT